MRKVSVTIAAIAMLGAAALGGCQTTPTVNVNTIITDVQTACKFVPTAQTVLSVLSVLPAGAAVNVIVSALCAAAGGAPAPAIRGAAAEDHVIADHIVVNGKVIKVPVVGHWN